MVFEFHFVCIFGLSWGARLINNHGHNWNSQYVAFVFSEENVWIKCERNNDT